MKIHLFLDHTALLVNDGSSVLTVEPACAGVLEIEGRRLRVSPSGTELRPMSDLVGHARVTFTTEKGVRYVGIRPCMTEGLPVSHVDYAAEYASIRVHVDKLERQMEALAAQFHRLSAETKRDALSFLIHNTNKQEVE